MTWIELVVLAGAQPDQLRLADCVGVIMYSKTIRDSNGFLACLARSILGLWRCAKSKR